MCYFNSGTMIEFDCINNRDSVIEDFVWFVDYIFEDNLFILVYFGNDVTLVEGNKKHARQRRNPKLEILGLRWKNRWEDFTTGHVGFGACCLWLHAAWGELHPRMMSRVGPWKGWRNI